MRPQLKGVIFDLDGTIVDSKLDFDLMRREIGILDKHPVLEYVEQLPEGDRKRECWKILLKHELRGAQEATLMPGMADFLKLLKGMDLHLGILTRNMGAPTRLTLERLALTGFSQVLTREDAPAKPDPTGLLKICSAWGCAPHEAIFVGDYKFDLLAGQRAGMKTILYATRGRPDFADQADHVTSDFADLALRFTQVAQTLSFVLPS